VRDAVYYFEMPSLRVLRRAEPARRLREMPDEHLRLPPAAQLLFMLIHIFHLPYHIYVAYIFIEERWQCAECGERHFHVARRHTFVCRRAISSRDVIHFYALCALFRVYDAFEADDERLIEPFTPALE